MPSALVSVLIPCFNAERFVGEAIQSALSQDYRPIEVVVLDDGSSDGSLEIIQSFARDERVAWEAGPNRGGNAARNRLLELAQGDFVQWLDADDLLYPEKVSRQIALFREGADMVFCDYVVKDLADRYPEHVVAKPALSGDILTYFIREGAVTMLPLHRREDLVRAHGFDESLQCCQEYELHLRLAQSSWRNVGHIREPLCIKRQYPQSVSSAEREVFLTKGRLLRALYEQLAGNSSASLERTKAIATALYICGRHLVREGETAAARRAFRLSKEIAPEVDLPMTTAMRKLTYVLGPVAAEHVRRIVRRVVAI